jgi:hypothetical protein
VHGTDDVNRQPIYNTPRISAQAIVGAFQFSILKCVGNLKATKIIYSDGRQKPYDKAKHFHYWYNENHSLEEFADTLRWLAEQPNKFIIRGQLLPGLDGPQRRLLKPHDGAPATIECPKRRWITLDLDGVTVPHGLGDPDKLGAAGYYIRDNLLPLTFRNIKCVATATASTGRKGPTIARLRLFFVLSHAVENSVLYEWIKSLAKEHPELSLDPSVMEVQQPIYTARPIFVGLRDPVPAHCRVRVLDGPAAQISYDWDGINGHKPKPKKIRVFAKSNIPAGETSDRAWSAIKRIFGNLDGCGRYPKVGETGRHKTLSRAAWELAHLVRVGELPVQVAKEAFLAAAEGIHNDDKVYDDRNLEQRFQDAIDDVERLQ